MIRKRSMPAWPFALVLVGFVISLFVGLTMWTERSLEFWLSRWKGEAVDVPLWMAFVVSLVLNGVILAANIVSELVRLVF